MKQLNNATKIVARILEIAHWVGAVLMIAVAICAKAAPQQLGHFMDIDTVGAEGKVSAYGFEVTLTNSTGQINMTTLLLMAIGAVIIFALMAMVFRNIYLIMKKSENASPFQKDNVRMVREIGIFSIAIPVVGLIMSVITRLAVGVDATEVSVNLSGFFTGIVILSLSQVFAHGVALEQDVDGLL